MSKAGSSLGRPDLHVLSLVAVLAGLVAGILALHLVGSAVAGFDPSDAGLGQNTVSWTSTLDGLTLSARGDRPDAVAEVVASIRELRAQGRPIALWLGASQLHAVNRAESGDEVASYFATRAAEARGSDLAYLQISSPNANLHDVLALYRRVRQEGVRPDWVIVALVYDDLKEEGLQVAISHQLLPLDAAETAAFGPGWETVERLRVASLEEKKAAPVERTALEETPQQRLEDAVVDTLETAWSAFASRGELTSWVRYHAVSLVSRWTGGLAGRRKSHVPDALRDWNLGALDSFVALAEEDGFALVVYKQPHRPDQPIFYHDREAYDSFHALIEERASTQGFSYTDLEVIVPSTHWGLTNGNLPDVFHFTVVGHRRLGQSIDAAIAGWSS